MTRPEKEYRRLPGRGRRRQGWLSAVNVTSTLWQGRDHLLSVDSSGGYAEDYRRFYFVDIQAITVRKSILGKVHNGVLGGLTALIALLTWPATEPVWLGIGLGFAGLFLLLLVGNLALGPTSVCHIRTAVQFEQLPSLGRLRRARRVLATLQPLIELAQANLPRPVPGAGPLVAVERVPAGPVMRPARATAERPASSPERPSTDSGRLHLWLFIVLLLEALRAGIAFIGNSMPLVLLEGLLWCAIALLTVGALFRQQGGRLTPALRGVTWVVMGYVILGVGTGYVDRMILATSAPSSEGPLNEWQIRQRYALRSPSDSAWTLGYMTWGFAAPAALGAVGFLLLSRHRRVEGSGPLNRPIPAASGAAPSRKDPPPL